MVYLVSRIIDPYGNENIEGVFSTEEKAQAYIDSLPDGHKDIMVWSGNVYAIYGIIEYEIDQPKRKK